MKRIVLCADGTWNEPEKKDDNTGRPQPTNVLKVARAVRPRSATGADQVVYYHPGVGTDGGLDTFTGGAFGSGMSENVRELYRFLVYNYEPDDDLFLFGFSRGAFTVRTLVGLMSRIGLVQKADEYYTGELYELYQSNIPADSDQWRHAFRNVEGARRCPPILFIGVWDTVGSLGAPGAIGQLFSRKKYAFHDIGLSPAIQNAYHALAIDERRKPFEPSIWTKPAGWSGTLEQVWFPGAHSNVGGSYHPDGLANEALHWMVGKAERLGLEFDQDFLRNYRPCFNSKLVDSMTTMYKLMGPKVRTLGDHPNDGEAIHQSALDRLALTECNYRPKNLQDYVQGTGVRIVTTEGVQRGKKC